MNSSLYIETGMAPRPHQNDLISIFHSTCSDILDSIAHFRTKSAKVRSDPWLNETTLTQSCIQAEHRYRKDKLHVSQQIQRESLTKEAKSVNLSNIISTSSNNPRVLFSKIQSVISPFGSTLINVVVSTCERFLHHFVDKVAAVRMGIDSNAHDPDTFLLDPLLFFSRGSRFNCFWICPCCHFLKWSRGWDSLTVPSTWCQLNCWNRSLI